MEATDFHLQVNGKFFCEPLDADPAGTHILNGVTCITCMEAYLETVRGWYVEWDRTLGHITGLKRKKRGRKDHEHSQTRVKESS